VHAYSHTPSPAFRSEPLSAAFSHRAPRRSAPAAGGSPPGAGHSVSRTGGHLAAGLGVVDLTVALHYVFDTPNDRLI